MPAAVHREFVLGAATSTQVLDLNPLRRWAILQNDSDSEIYLALEGPAAVNKGIRLNASGGAFIIDPLNPWTGKVFAFCSAASKRILTVEL